MLHVWDTCPGISRGSQSCQQVREGGREADGWRECGREGGGGREEREGGRGRERGRDRGTVMRCDGVTTVIGAACLGYMSRHIKRLPIMSAGYTATGSTHQAKKASVNKNAICLFAF